LGKEAGALSKEEGHQIDVVVALAMAVEAAERKPEPVGPLGWL
jgi:hypothetical protein